MSHNRFKELLEADEKWDSIVAQGWLVVLTTPQFTVLISIYTFAFVFLAKRLFRVWTLLLFLWLLPESRRESRVDQMRVAAVNMRTPTHVLSETITWRSCFKKKGVERLFASLWLFGAVLFMGLSLASTYWLTLFPVVNGVPGEADECAAEADVSDPLVSERINFRNLMWRHESQDALSYTDGMGYNYDARGAADLDLRARDVVSKGVSCPNFTSPSACADGDAMHFHGEFWIKPSDLGIGDVRGMDFGVGVDCYKVRSAENFLGLRLNSTFSYREYGLMYGGFGKSLSGEDEIDTARILREEVHGHGYSVHSIWYFQEKGDGSPPQEQLWRPRADLLHEGDLSLLLYNLGATYTYDSSDDPLFRTTLLRTTNLPLTGDWADENLEERPRRPDPNGRVLHKPINQTVAVVCNTTYSICDTSMDWEVHETCRRLGGFHRLKKFIDKQYSRQANSTRVGFLNLMLVGLSEPGMAMAEVSNGVLAGSSLMALGKIQSRIREITGQKELTRLFLATRTKLILSARRTAVHGWLLPLLQAGYSPNEIVQFRYPSITSMCQATLIRDPDCFTTTAKPWTIVACVWLFVILMTYSAPVFQMLHVAWISKIARHWRGREVGVLHSQLAEPRFTVPMEEDGHKAIKSWPLLGKGDMPSVIYETRGLTGSDSAEDIDVLCMEDRSSMS